MSQPASTSAAEDLVDPGASEPDSSRQDSSGTRNTEWIAEVVDQFQRPLLAYATGMLADRTAAQDAVQETFLQLCRKRPDDLVDRLAPWLFTVCRSRVIDMQRKRSPDRLDPDAVAVIDPAPRPDAVAQDHEAHEQIAASIETLSPRQREVIQLRMQAGLSYREIADVTGMTVSNVGFHLHQAVKSLRDGLAVT